MIAIDYPPLLALLASAQTPILVVTVVAEECNEFKTQYTEALEEGIKKYTTLDIPVVQYCYAEDTMPFPRFQAPALYYFLPKTPVPIFWRGLEAHAKLQEDIGVIERMFTQGLAEHDARFTPEVKLDIAKVDAMLESEDVSQFPSLFQQSRNLAKEMWKLGKRAATLQPLIVPASVASERLETCQACPEFEESSGRCKKCGCGMRIKANLESASCPLSKWKV